MRQTPAVPISTALILLAACAACLLLPAAGSASLITFGSPLSEPATLNTAENLAYQGTNTPLPGMIFHTPHYGADTALWNAAGPQGKLGVPVGGEVTKVMLEGCAMPASGGPPPLTQIHFQALAPQPDGSLKVELTSSAFEVPVCGVNGASGSTVSTYVPYNLCVSEGDYVSFNDEGGYVENVYRAGVPYEVLGAAQGGTLDSFIRGNGTGNGAVFRPTDVEANEGFASTSNEELMMQVLLGTGPNARYACPGGSKEAPPVLAPMHVHPQTDGINAQRVVEVAAYCRPASGCRGTATITAQLGGVARVVGQASFRIGGNSTGHIPVRVSPSLMRLIRSARGASTTFTALFGGQSFKQTVVIKVL